IEAIRLLEDLKDAACAAQAELAVGVVAAEVAAAEAVADDVDVDAECASRAKARRVARARRSAIGQVALARRESAHMGGVFVGIAEALVHEMPCTFEALKSGALNEYRARTLVRETACLTREDRAAVDSTVCGDPRGLAGVGNKRLAAIAKHEGYSLDPHAIVRRAELDAAERRVTLRPAPGSMTYLTALVPMAQGVAVLANLQRAAEAARATGDERSKGQIMADTLVERLTGQDAADAVPVMVNLVVSDATLLASGHEPGVLDGANMVPAQLARDLVARAMDGQFTEAEDESATEPTDQRREANKIGAWVRRLYADAGGNLVAMDSRSRTFPAGLAALLRVRDQGLCRTPWCDAPVAHLDHVTPVADGGATSAPNGQGLCAGCNYTKQAPGWTQHVEPDAAVHTVTTTTPSGHEYISMAAGVPVPISGASSSAPSSDLGAVKARSEREALVLELYPPHPLEPIVEVHLRHAA
ncbi:MAG: HNH endonuclease, partial [Actinomycetales bacterium]|nr:HNH endonuclease [Actinomycetales bacterium]